MLQKRNSIFKTSASEQVAYLHKSPTSKNGHIPAEDFEEIEEQKYSRGKRYLPAEFCLESSLHGLRFIGQPKRHVVERIFWIISFSVAVIVAVALILEIWEKFRKTPVITVFRPSELAIESIPFPAVTVCNTNNVIKSKAEQFVKRVENDPNNPEANRDLYLLDHICQTSTTFSEAFNFSLEYGGIKREMRQQILDAKSNTTTPTRKNVKITDLLQDVAQKCSEMILLCKWHDEVVNCSEIFDEVETDFGNDSRDKENTVKEWQSLHLDTDNMILNDEGADDYEYDDDIRLGSSKKPPPKFPYRQSRPGKTTGLSILLDPDLDSYFCTNTDSAGFMVLAHIPLDFPRVADESIAIKPNSETYLKIRPEIILADEEIRGFELKKRNCYFGREYTLKYFSIYTTTNCENECIANITMKECGCVRYFMPRDEHQTICGANRFNCSEMVRKVFLNEGLKKRCRVCLPTCTEIEYHMTSSYMPLRSDIPLWEHTNGTEASWTQKNVSILHVHFSVDSTYPKLRKELYGFMDLVANTGGLLGLCLGFSVLSLLEILYFLTLRLYCKTRRGKAMGHKLTSTVQALWGKVFGSVNSMRKISVMSKKAETYPCYEENVLLRSVLVNGNKPSRISPRHGGRDLDQTLLRLDTLPHYVDDRDRNFIW